MALFRRLRTRLGLRKPTVPEVPEGLSVGKHTYRIDRSNAYSVSKVSPLTIGAYCSIADEVVFICHGRHDPDFTTTFPVRQGLLDAPREYYLQVKRGIEVGNDVWIGRRAMIMPGVSIGDGAVIGAGSVVTADVAPYTIVAGNPARLVRHRFPEEVVRALLAIKWWNWTEESIKQHADLLQGPVEAFLATFSENPGAPVARDDRKAKGKASRS